jgi:hypothetical protein
MKRLIYSTFALLLLISCKKEIKNSDSSGYIENVKAALKDSVSLTDYSDLEFSKAILSKDYTASLYFLRIPFKGKKIENDFLIIMTSINGIIKQGKIVHIEGQEIERKWNGNITISSLDKKNILNSEINNGYILAFHSGINLRTDAMAPVYPDPYKELPEVIVVAYIRDGGISTSDWMLLQSLFYNYATGSGGEASGFYGSMDGTGGGGSSTSILVDYDGQYGNPAIDLSKYVKCFTNIPDAGASCSIEILTDIPVDSDPGKFFDWSNGSPGHTFLQIRKTNGTQSAMENIGFYPRSGWKTTITTAPIDGKFVDNSGHEYNASLKMNITPTQLKSAIAEIQYLGRFVKYDIDEYNCTDWALEVFNYVRSPLNQLVIPKYDLPGDAAPYGTSTPSGLYQKLQQIKKAGGTEAANVDMGFKKGYVASSTGPCN